MKQKIEREVHRHEPKPMDFVDGLGKTVTDPYTACYIRMLCATCEATWLMLITIH